VNASDPVSCFNVTANEPLDNAPASTPAIDVAKDALKLAVAVFNSASVANVASNEGLNVS